MSSCENYTHGRAPVIQKGKRTPHPEIVSPSIANDATIGATKAVPVVSRVKVWRLPASTPAIREAHAAKLISLHTLTD
jgi:hypothetical protein